MKIKILGCSGGIGNNRKTTSFLLDDFALIDAGTGLDTLTIQEMSGIRHVFLTHAHLDHINCLPSLLDNLINLADRSISVHGPAKTLDALQQHIFNNIIWPDFTRMPSSSAPVARFMPDEPGRRQVFENFSIESIKVRHRCTAVGYLICAPDHTMAFSGDTTVNDTFWERLNQAGPINTLVVECAFPDRNLPLARSSMHYCPSLLGKDIKKLDSRPLIYITHLKPGFETEIMQECINAMPDHVIKRLRDGDILPGT